MRSQRAYERRIETHSGWRRGEEEEALPPRSRGVCRRPKPTRRLADGRWATAASQLGYSCRTRNSRLSFACYTDPHTLAHPHHPLLHSSHSSVTLHSSSLFLTSLQPPLSHLLDPTWADWETTLRPSALTGCPRGPPPLPVLPAGLPRHTPAYLPASSLSPPLDIFQRHPLLLVHCFFLNPTRLRSQRPNPVPSRQSTRRSD
jgi:hypothetical protein